MSNNEITAAIETALEQEPLSQVAYRRMSDITAEPIKWLWQGRIALGKITVIAGNPGLGKSQIMAATAAIVTNGWEWPDGAPATMSGSVIFLSAEDDAADTIKPRLIAAGAIISDTYILDHVARINSHGTTAECHFDLGQDLSYLEQVIVKVGNVRVVVIDPVSAYQGKVDANSNTEIRNLLAPLSKLAAKYGIAVLLITHLNKSKDQDPMARVIGSTGLIAAARAGYAVIKDRNDPETRYFLPIKNNLGNDRNGLAFTVEGVELEGEISTSKINWLPELVDANALLFSDEKFNKSSAKEADDFLKTRLSKGPQAVKEVMEEAQAAGFSNGVIQRASKRLGVKKRKEGIKGPWVWHFPLNDRPSIRLVAEDGEDVEGDT